MVGMYFQTPWSTFRFGNRWRAVCGVTAAATAFLGNLPEALAHGAPLDRRVRWYDWNWDPVLLLSLTLAIWLYARGLTEIWDRAGTGHVVSRIQAGAFAAGMLALMVALVSPLDPLGEQVAWAHMVQHMLVMTVAAPLLLLGSPLYVWLWALSPASRRALGQWWLRLSTLRFLWRLTWAPLVAWTVYAVVTWAWHLPLLYNAALRYPWAHDLQHFCFFAAACLFWRVLVDPFSRLRMANSLGVLYLFTTTMHATLLGALMTVAPSPWYPDYIGRAELWGLTALEDQQLAGLIMWMPACAAYLLVAIVLLAKSLESHAASAPRFVFAGKGAA